MPTGFFDLPPELRDKIYSLVWDSLPNERPPLSPHNLTNQFPSLRNEIEWNQPIGPIKWVMTCKSILEEAVNEFFRKRFVRLELRHWPAGNTSFNPDYILAPTKAQEVYIHAHARGTFGWHETSQGRRPTYYLRHLHKTHEAWIRKFMQQLAQWDRIRVLKVTLELDCENSNLPQSFQLKPLRLVSLIAKRLFTYEIYLDSIKFPHDADQLKAMNAIKPSVMAEVDLLRKTCLAGMDFKMEGGWVQGEDARVWRWALRFRKRGSKGLSKD